jgi:hypothetical protein
MLYLKNFFLLILISSGIEASIAQDTSPDSSYKIIAAGPEYKKPGFYQWLWGKNRRKEWTIPIRVPVVNLDTLYGGLHPYAQGGGNETKSLRLTNTAGREFTMRSINKSRKDVVSPEFEGTFIEDIIQDGVSMSYPYAAFAVPKMQENAGIPHTNPILTYVPPQHALDTFNNRFGNDLYLLEQRPDGDWSISDNLGNFTRFNSTSRVIEKLLDDNDNSADQRAFIKVRLFDMLVNDWDRHEDNWRWGVVDSGKSQTFTPIPRDRDQAFYTKNGILISMIISATDLKFMQDFTRRVKDIHLLNLEQRNMDRFFTNRMNLNDWINIAKELQQSLSDAVIVKSVKALPPEIFDISGLELIEKLKSRRNQLDASAEKYYRFLAKEVQVPGSNKKEYFEVKRLSTGETEVNVFKLNKRSEKNDSAFYSRTFYPGETKEIRLYGLNGGDTYAIYDKSPDIKLRIIGGSDSDSILQYTNDKIHIYDDRNNSFKTTSARLHLSHDSAIHAFNYEGYNYNVRHFVPYVLFNNRDRWYFGWNYSFLKHKWRRVPYANIHTIGINYYGATRAVSASASIQYPNVIGKWSFTLYGAYNALKWTNFFGTGNETILTSADRTYNRIRSIDWSAKAGISRGAGKNSFAFLALFEGTKILNDTSRYVAKVLRNEKEFRPNHYIGLQFTYSYLTLNDSIVPTKGFSFLANAGAYRNITQSDFFQNYAGRFQAYLPLTGKFSLAIRSGVETIVGNSSLVNNAQFYQHAIIGGPVNVRGYRAERFWGRTSFYNQNELRYITKIKTKIMNAKAGVIAFFDNGRVWMPEDTSKTLHTSYGGGILIAPFYKICVTVVYGITKETNLLQFGINTLF